MFRPRSFGVLTHRRGCNLSSMEEPWQDQVKLPIYDPRCPETQHQNLIFQVSQQRNRAMKEVLSNPRDTGKPVKCRDMPCHTVRMLNP